MHVFRSDGRYKTEEYTYGQERRICIAEKTGRGVLITELGIERGVFFQEYREGNIEGCLKGHIEARLGPVRLSFYDTEYERTCIGALCGRCGTQRPMKRELELLEPEMIYEVPVLPVFICTACGSRYSSVTREYIMQLALEKRAYFSEEEGVEMERNMEEFINTLEAYIVKVLAAKKISILNTKR